MLSTAPPTPTRIEAEDLSELVPAPAGSSYNQKRAFSPLLFPTGEHRFIMSWLSHDLSARRLNNTACWGMGCLLPLSCFSRFEPGMLNLESSHDPLAKANRSFRFSLDRSNQFVMYHRWARSPVVDRAFEPCLRRRLPGQRRGLMRLLRSEVMPYRPRPPGQLTKSRAG